MSGSARCCECRHGLLDVECVGGVIVDVAGVFIIRLMDYLVLAIEMKPGYVSV